MRLTDAELGTIHQIAKIVHGFLPGTAHQYRSDQSMSFLAVARRLGLSELWTPGETKPGVVSLLEKTFEGHRSVFGDLVLQIVRKGAEHRTRKGTFIPRRDILDLADLASHLDLDLPQLLDAAFLEAFPPDD